MYRFGVRVVYVEPGFFDTNLLAAASANGAAADQATKAAAPKKAEACEEDGVAALYPSFDSKMESSAAQIRQVERLNGGPKGVDQIVDATVDAICNAVPLLRYTVGIDALLMRYVLVWTPDRIVDLAQWLM